VIVGSESRNSAGTVLIYWLSHACLVGLEFIQSRPMFPVDFASVLNRVTFSCDSNINLSRYQQLVNASLDTFRCL